MKYFTVLFALIAIGFGYVMFSPMQVKELSYRCRLILHLQHLVLKMGTLGEKLGIAPSHVIQNTIVSFLPKLPAGDLKITEEKFGGVRSLLIRPPGAVANGPALVFFHGGGWVLFNPEFYLHVLTEMASRLQMVVVAFDYRKAPEHPFPTPFDDCLAGLLSFAEAAPRLGLDPKRLVVAGDSAGGNLALSVVAHLHSGAVPETTLRVAALGLFYPALQALDFKLPSYVENAREPMLKLETMIHFWQMYATGVHDQRWVGLMRNNSHASEATRKRANDLLWRFLSSDAVKEPDGPVDQAASKALAAATSDVLISPILLPDRSLLRLPPIYLLSSHFDVLRDESLAFVKRLKTLGHAIEHQHVIHYHGVFNLMELESTRIMKRFVSYVQQNL